MNSKNKIAGIMKIGSIVLLVLSFLGAIAISQKETTTYTAPKYSWEDEGSYDTEKTFDGGLFFTTIISSAISCALIYGFGELIDIEDKKHKYLIAKFGAVEETAPEAKTE